MPKRIQRKRTKGWRMPEGAVFVGRPSRWGNPWRVVRLRFPLWSVVQGVVGTNAVYLGTFATEEQAVYWAVQGFKLHPPADVSPLRGHDLACWCPLDQPCHADVLLELANR